MCLFLSGLEAYVDEDGYIPEIRYILQKKKMDNSDDSKNDSNNNATEDGESLDSESSDSDNSEAQEMSESKS